MDNDDPNRRLLVLIRDFSAEKTKGERRVSDLKKRGLELEADYEVATAELEKTKRVREAAEKELRGSQAQLDRTNASLLSIEARNSGLQDEIFQVSSELQAIMSGYKIQRDEFIRAMHEFNSKIRTFNEMAFQALKKEHYDLLPNTDQDQEMDMQSESTQKGLENEILSIDAEMLTLDGEYQKVVNDVNKVHEELADLKKKVFVSEAIMLQSERLKELSCQISELQKAYSSLGEELQRQYICPRCQFNNIEASA